MRAADSGAARSRPWLDAQETLRAGCGCAHGAGSSDADEIEVETPRCALARRREYWPGLAAARRGYRRKELGLEWFQSPSAGGAGAECCATGCGSVQESELGRGSDGMPIQATRVIASGLQLLPGVGAGLFRSFAASLARQRPAGARRRSVAGIGRRRQIACCWRGAAARHQGIAGFGQSCVWDSVTARYWLHRQRGNDADGGGQLAQLIWRGSARLHCARRHPASRVGQRGVLSQSARASSLVGTIPGILVFTCHENRRRAKTTFVICAVAGRFVTLRYPMALIVHKCGGTSMGSTEPRHAIAAKRRWQPSGLGQVTSRWLSCCPAP